MASARVATIVATARELLEEEGREAVSMRRIAERMGIRAPSLYKHVPDKLELEAAIISEGLVEWAIVFEEALAAGGDPLPTLATAYRCFAREHPHLYRLMTEEPLPRARLAPGAEARAAAPVLLASGGDVDLARAVWAFAHGMTILELNDRFPPDADIDAAWQRGIDAFSSR